MQDRGRQWQLRVPTLVREELPMLRRMNFLADDSALALDFSNQEVDAPEQVPWTGHGDTTRRFIIMSATTGALLYTSHIMDHRRLTTRRGFTVLPGPFYPAPLHDVIPPGAPHFLSARPAPHMSEPQQGPSVLTIVNDHAEPMACSTPVSAAVLDRNIDQDPAGVRQTGQKPDMAPGTFSLQAVGASQTQAGSPVPHHPTSGLLLHHEATVVHLSAVHLASCYARCKSDMSLVPGPSPSSIPARVPAGNSAAAAASSAALLHSDAVPEPTQPPSDSMATFSPSNNPPALGTSSPAGLPPLPQRSTTEVPLINPNDPYAVLDASTPVLDLRQQGQLFPHGGPHSHITYGQSNMERYYPDFHYPPGGPTSSVLVSDPGCGGVMVQAHSHLMPQLARLATPSAAEFHAQSATGRWFSPSGTLLIRLERLGDATGKDCVLLHTTVGHGHGTQVALHINDQDRRSYALLAQVARLEWVPNSREAIYGFVCRSPIVYLMDAIHHQVSLILTRRISTMLVLFTAI